MSQPIALIISDDETTASDLRSAIATVCDGYVSGRDPASVAQGLSRKPLITFLDLESSSQPHLDDGLRLLRALRETGNGGKVIVYTWSPERSVAVQAVRLGAMEILSQPLDLGLVTDITRRALRIADLEREAHANHREDSPQEFKGMLGTSSSMCRIFDAIRKVSTNDAPVLIMGERGTGKELTAKAIHEQGLRNQAPFIPVNCGAIPESLLDSELFGQGPGAFTGMARQKQGKIELAQGGTLFLDEVNELPPSLQGKLLRFLQNSIVERIGGHQAIDKNVRLIAATNVNLQEAVEKGMFREDLHGQLGVVQINLPPLRERSEDLLLIATHFLRQASAHYGKSIHGFTREAIETMRSYTWPGNVRELFNRVGRAVVMAEGTHVKSVDLDIPHQKPRPEEGSISLKINQQRIETDLIMKAVTISQGNLSRAAHELGISRSTLYRRLRQYGMDRTFDARRALGTSPSV